VSVATAQADAAAASVGAPDLFVLRRVAGPRFVHFGGSGRGNGWAGLVEIALDDEAPLAKALATGRPVRLEHGGRDLVFGPYYARAAAIVPVPPDVVVVFGAPDGTIEAGDDALRAAARTAAHAIESVTPAKQLADELELLEAIRAAAAVPTAQVDETMRALADATAAALSCELGIAYLENGNRIGVAERGWTLTAGDDALAEALSETVARAGFPFCVQDAQSSPLPGALAAEPGIRSYYLLELTGLARGALLVAHTDAAPRGFTLLCRRLGLRVAEVASSVLGVALTQEWLAAEAARLHAAFGELER
jgi:hypothetical protein